MTSNENYDSESDEEEPKFEKITINTDYKIKTSLEEPPTDLELKPLPDNLEYVFLEEPSFLPVNISSQLSAQTKANLYLSLKNIKKHLPGKQQTFLEFDVEIKENKGTENVVADHLSRIDNNETSDDSEVDDNFPEETLMEINTRDEAWFADFANYLGIDFMGPCLKSHKFEYILITINDVSKWAEAQALTTNDGRVVITFLKKLFCHFGMPNMSLHHTTLKQVVKLKTQNRVLKRILENNVKDNPAIWSRKLDDAMRAFRTACKTPTGTTPYKLIYGKNCHVPFEIKHRAYWALKNCNPDLIVASEK
ncbi:reverse transcriptase domain-containing protein [Tanacetum coccineum]